MIIGRGVNYHRCRAVDQDRAVTYNCYRGFPRILLAAFCRDVMISRLNTTPLRARCCAPRRAVPLSQTAFGESGLGMTASRFGQ